MNRTLGALALVAGLLAIGGISVGAFFYGQSTRDEGQAERDGYAQGLKAARSEIPTAVASERESTELRVRSEFDPGHSGYQRIYDKGRAAGLRTGRQAGLETGRHQGLTSGQDLAFEGYEGGWSIGRWYLIEIGSGDDRGTSAKYSIPSRVGPMRFGIDYALCADGDGICNGPG